MPYGQVHGLGQPRAAVVENDITLAGRTVSNVIVETVVSFGIAFEIGHTRSRTLLRA